MTGRSTPRNEEIRETVEDTIPWKAILKSEGEETLLTP
jgi:hypothetical protein